MRRTQDKVDDSSEEINLAYPVPGAADLHSHISAPLSFRTADMVLQSSLVGQKLNLTKVDKFGVQVSPTQKRRTVHSPINGHRADQENISQMVDFLLLTL